MERAHGSNSRKPSTNPSTLQRCRDTLPGSSTYFTNPTRYLWFKITLFSQTRLPLSPLLVVTGLLSEITLFLKYNFLIFTNYFEFPFWTIVNGFYEKRKFSTEIQLAFARAQNYFIACSHFGFFKRREEETLWKAHQRTSPLWMSVASV